MKSIYIFSGLGADERVFKYVNFPDCEPIFIRWIIPTKHEKIEDYAKRLTEQILTEKPILIGLSFGGMTAIEVAKHIKTEKIILIASAKTWQEIPFYYRLAGMLKLHQLLPAGHLKRPNFLSAWFFGATSAADKKMLADILRDTDPVFLKWAMNQIANWKNQIVHQNLTHIHGTADRILPFCFVACDFKIVSGGHLMTLNKAEQINSIIRRLL